MLLTRLHWRIQQGNIHRQFLGETETRLRDIFEEAKANTPSILLIDDLDSLFPSREAQGVEEYHRRALSSLLSEFDSLKDSAVVVLAATSRLAAVDSALRRPGRLDKEVEIAVPSATGRQAILAGMLGNAIAPQHLAPLVAETHGFVGADLAALCREAGEKAILRAEKNGCEPEISWQDLTLALPSVSPSALKDIIIEVPKVHWTDIGGYEAVKTQIKQAVLWPLQYPEDFKRMGVKPPRGVLLYGPPGCCKTMLAKAVATESSMNFIAIKGPELFSKYVGDTEKAIRDIFRRARTSAPCVVFIDELDSMATKREGTDTGVNERVLCTLLNELDGIEVLNDVLVLGATNRPEMIDKALIRPGRMDRLIYIAPPDLAARKEILEIAARGMPLAADVNLQEMATRVDGYSGAEVSLIPREAGLVALSEDIHSEEVASRHFEAALRKVKPRISRQMILGYEGFDLLAGRADSS